LWHKVPLKVLGSDLKHQQTSKFLNKTSLI